MSDSSKSAQKKYRAAGLCINCGKNKLTTKNLCDYCAMVHRLATRTLKQRNLEAGRCVNCSKKHNTGCLMCAKCRKKYNKARRETYFRKKGDYEK